MKINGNSKLLNLSYIIFHSDTAAAAAAAAAATAAAATAAAAAAAAAAATAVAAATTAAAAAAATATATTATATTAATTAELPRFCFLKKNGCDFLLKKQHFAIELLRFRGILRKFLSLGECICDPGPGDRAGRVTLCVFLVPSLIA